MLDAEVAQPNYMCFLRAVFSDFIAEPGLPLIGGVDRCSPIFDLCDHLKHFLDFEVYNQPDIGSPIITPDNAVWVTPHITLTPPLVAADLRTVHFQGSCATERGCVKKEKRPLVASDLRSGGHV